MVFGNNEVLLSAFQYRKRYELHAIIFRLNILWMIPSFNTASGMNCMQLSVLQDFNFSLKEFQYRKRYELHAILNFDIERKEKSCFNTASGMNCMQFFDHHQCVTPDEGFNTASGMNCMQYQVSFHSYDEYLEFQYRKRYELHAMWKKFVRGWLAN